MPQELWLFIVELLRYVKGCGSPIKLYRLERDRLGRDKMRNKFKYINLVGLETISLTRVKSISNSLSYFHIIYTGL